MKMLLFYLLSALFGVLLVVIRYSLWREKYCQNLPGVKPGFFNIPGDLTTVFIKSIVTKHRSPILQSFLECLKEKTERFQQHRLFCVWAFYTPHVCLVKAEAVKQLLSKGMGQNEKSWHYDIFKPLLGDGLITSTMKMWRPKRKQIEPCFHTDILRGFIKVFDARSKKLVEHLRAEVKEDFTHIHPIVTLTALDIVMDTIFGATIDALEHDDNFLQYVHMMKSVLDAYMSRFLKIWEWPDFLFQLTSGREVKRRQAILYDVVKSYIEEKKKKYLREKECNVKSKRKSFMDILLDLHLDTQELSEEDLSSEVNTFIAAGHETVSVTVTWALHLIGHSPEVQEKIHEELDRIFESDVERDITESDLNDLKYLDCVIKETQRLYPAIPLIARDLKEDSNICGYRIPKDTTCVVIIYSLHRDREVFPDPEQFDPDRFLPENSVHIPEYAYIPFSAGPRICIGQKYSIMEMKCILASIFRNYTVKSLDARDKVLPLMQITLHPSIPIRIRFRERKSTKCGDSAFL